MTTLSRTHGTRMIRQCNVHVRGELDARRIFGPGRYLDLSDTKAAELGAMCEGISREAAELETKLNAALADNVVTPEECDGLIAPMRKIVREAEEGRAL